MAPSGAVEAGRYDHSFHSGTDLHALCVYFIHIVDLVGLELEPGGQERLDVKGVLGVRVGGVRVIGVLGDVVLVREERPHTAQLEDDRKSTRLNSSHVSISYAVFCLKKKRTSQ